MPSPKRAQARRFAERPRSIEKRNDWQRAKQDERATILEKMMIEKMTSKTVQPEPF